MNLAFHYACELRRWFPWLDCDFDVSKRSSKFERPDIILHRRNTHALNFLVIEVKRETKRRGVAGDLHQIRDRWFENVFRYRFGAAVILDDKAPTFEMQVLSRHAKNDAPVILKSSNMGEPLSAPNFARVRRKTFTRTIGHIVAARQQDNSANVSEFEREIDQHVLALFGLNHKQGA